jgi:hypothetical protein
MQIIQVGGINPKPITAIKVGVAVGSERKTNEDDATVPTEAPTVPLANKNRPVG